MARVNSINLEHCERLSFCIPLVIKISWYYANPPPTCFNRGLIQLENQSDVHETSFQFIMTIPSLSGQVV